MKRGANEEVEAVAKAIWEATRPNLLLIGMKWEREAPITKSLYRDAARAAISLIDRLRQREEKVP